MSGVGGYVRRGERLYIPPEPPEPDVRIPRCERCHARLDLCVVSPVHLCKEFIFGSMPGPLPFLPIPVPDGAGEVLHNILGGDPQPGPPYVHTFKAPEPIGELEDGTLIYPPPGPAFTLTERPVAEVVAEAGFGPVPERVEVTAEFCQCPACKRERCEP